MKILLKISTIGNDATERPLSVQRERRNYLQKDFFLMRIKQTK